MNNNDTFLDSFPKRLAALSALIIVLGACSGDQQSDGDGEVESVYNTTLNMRELMALVLEPASDVLWDSGGWVLDAAGYEEPQSSQLVVIDDITLIMAESQQSSDFFEGGFHQHFPASFKLKNDHRDRFKLQSFYRQETLAS